MSASVAPAPTASFLRRSSSLSSPIVRKASAYASRVASQLSTATPPTALQIVCSPAVFCCLWLLINSFQLGVSLALMRALYSYVWTLLDHEEIVAALRQFGLEFNSHVMVGSVVASVATMNAHLTDVAHSVHYSIRRRRLVLRDAGDDSNTPVVSKRPRWWQRWRWTWPAWIESKMELARRVVRACGVHGAYFNASFYGRELLEICLQTYQTYRVSYAVGEAWINTLAVGVVVANCWTTPLLDLWLHGNEPRRRIMCLAVDVLLDAVAGLVLPFFVYASYRSKLPRMDWYDPLWIMDAGNDLMYFHINTWLDLLSRLMPGFSMISCLHAIRAMLKTHQPRPQGSLSSTRSLAVLPQPRKLSTRPPVVVASRPRVTLIHKLLFGYGTVVLTLGVLARNGPHLTPALVGCQKAARPWLLPNAKFPCAVLELNCLEDPHLTTNNAAIQERLADADASTLASLAIVHCQQVRMPARMRAFRYLLWLEIYNSTPDASALTQTTHPSLSRVLFVRSAVDTATMSVDMLLQRLVLSPILPRTLLDVAIVASNLSTVSLPVAPSATSGLTTRHLQSLVLQQCELTAIPSLRSVHIHSLSLAMNPIADTNLDAVHAIELSLQSTRVEACSATVSSTPTVAIIQAAGSPLCTQSPADQALRCPGSQPVDCNPCVLFPLRSLDIRRRSP